MADQKVLESLFNEAKRLFGNNSLATASVQNPGCLKVQQDVEDVFQHIYEHMTKAADQHKQWVRDANIFIGELRNAFIKGQL